MSEKKKLRVERVPEFYVLERTEPITESLEKILTACGGIVIRTHNAARICGASGIIADITEGGTAHGSIIENGIAADVPTCVLYTAKAAQDGEYFLARQEGPPEIERLQVHKYNTEEERVAIASDFLKKYVAEAQRNGAYIVLDGPDGGGKTTQAKLLKLWLDEQGYDVMHIREPGGTSIGEQIRKILLDPENKVMSPRTEMKLYQSVRGQLVQEIVRPALKEGKIVVSERNYFSTLVYQGHGLGIDLQTIRNESMFVMQGTMPDLAFILRVPPKVGNSRMGSRSKDRIEARVIEYHKKVYQGFSEIRQTEHSVRIIDAVQRPEVVATEIQTIIAREILNKSLPYVLISDDVR